MSFGPSDVYLFVGDEVADSLNECNLNKEYVFETYIPREAGNCVVEALGLELIANSLEHDNTRGLIFISNNTSYAIESYEALRRFRLIQAPWRQGPPTQLTYIVSLGSGSSFVVTVKEVYVIEERFTHYDENIMSVLEFVGKEVNIRYI